MKKYLLFLIVLLALPVLAVTAQTAPDCDPAAVQTYLSMRQTDVDLVRTLIGQVTTEITPGEFYRELTAIRRKYEDIQDVPACLGEVHRLMLAQLSANQDAVAFAQFGALADEQTTLMYGEQITATGQRLSELNAAMQAELAKFETSAATPTAVPLIGIQPPATLPPTNVPATPLPPSPVPTLAPTSTPLAAAPVVISTRYIFSSTPVNVRSGPGTDQGVIGSLNQGSMIEVTGEQGGWYKIKFNGGEGWVFGDLTTATAPLQQPAAASGGSGSGAAPINAAPVQPQPATGVQCEGATACTQMTSCEQAYACLQAGDSGLDRDRDGVPCEDICPGG